MDKTYNKLSNLFVVLLMMFNILLAPVSAFAEEAASELETSVQLVETTEEEPSVVDENSATETETTTEATEATVETSGEVAEEGEKLEEVSEESSSEEAESKEEEINFSPVTGYTERVTATVNGLPLANGMQISGATLFSFRYDYEFPDSVTINNGDTLKITLPPQLNITAVGPFTINAPDGSPLGTATPNNNILTITFNDYFSRNKLNKRMFVSFSGAWSQNVPDGTTVPLQIGGNTYTVTKKKAEGPGAGELMSKWGTQDRSDEKVVNWRIRVNASLQNVEQSTLVDTIPAGQELIESSLTAIYARQFDPTVRSTGAVPASAITKSKNGFTINFGNGLKGTGAYISYQTRITSKPGSSFVENNAVLNANGRAIVTRNGIRANVIFKDSGGFGEDYDYIDFKAKKVLEGRDLQEGEFQFELRKDGTPIETVRNKADGSVSFSRITYDTAGVFNYTIHEVAGNLPGVTYDKTVQRITVTVVDKSGIKSAKAVYEAGDVPTFTNRFTPASAIVRARVKAEGCQVGPVQVELVAENGDVLQTVTATEPDGEVTFDAINYADAGRTTYTVRQKDVADTAHVQYDKEPKTVTITVTKNDATNALEAAEPATVVFNNQCRPVVPTEAVIKARVKAEGCQVGPVQVELVNAQDEVVETVTATEPDGEVTFTAVPLNAAGEVTYTVRQKDVADTAHVQYDKEPKTVTITVTKNDATNALEAAEPATVVFNNQCRPVVPTEAVIKARVKAEG
ncbi:Ig-like domain-containing protein, partial [Aerococcaceae bacterium NML191219]|nr:Ig-like domain-containing protein [Aerococcaceae bacterium NML191219]